MSWRLLCISLAAGLIAMTAQSILIRELVIAFLGNELVIATTLGAWLLWTGVGSIALGTLAERSRAPLWWLTVVLLLVAIFLPLSYAQATGARKLAGVAPGEIAGPVSVILTCLAILGPICFCNGAVFPTICRALAEFSSPGTAVSRVYVREAVGSALGGALFTFAIVEMKEPAYAVLLCSSVALGMARWAQPSRNGWVSVVFLIALLLVAAFSLCFFGSPSRSDHISTIYARTTVVKQQDTTSVFQNGILSATYPVAGGAEELAHLAMLQVEQPSRVLLIGGLCGTAEDILHYDGAQIDIVELDPRSVEFIRQRVPSSSLFSAALANGRARLVFRDGRRHVMRHEGEPYDAIILDLPKPVSAQINRYYTIEFFRAAARVLSDRGVLAFRVESAENISTPEIRDFVACLLRTLRAVFVDVAITPGTSNIFLAAKSHDLLTLDPDLLLRRLKKRKIRTAVFADTVSGNLEAFNVQLLRNVLSESRSSRINTDLHPISYSHGLAVWAVKDRTPRSQWLDRLIEKPAQVLLRFAALPAATKWGVGLAVAAACLVVLFLLRPRRNTAVGFAVACGGFTEISVEIAILLAFQALYGYVYALLGLILASFMVGLCVGGWLASRIVAQRSRMFRALALAQVALALHPLILIGSIRYAGIGQAPDWAVAVGFLSLTFIAGLVGGLQFPLAAAVAAGRSGNVAARLSALDLCGAAVGAFSVSTMLIPAVGLESLVVFLSGLGAIALAAIGAARSRASGATLLSTQSENVLCVKMSYPRGQGAGRAGRLHDAPSETPHVSPTPLEPVAESGDRQTPDPSHKGGRGRPGTC